MSTPCLTCHAALQPDDRFCARCGSPAAGASIVTGLAPAAPVAAAAVRGLSSDRVPAGGFTPGMLIAGRYRIVGLLGRGGMGEVYRADDLKLGQAVALKFLPPAIAGDPVRRERFYAEVRLARQISHPNICRVYDIAEVEGRTFLSMEYVDGEDLASLLTRIGHLPGAKAGEIARQLCAGLAAAHDKGVLHRDLKPANVMLDGRGRVRITDFGLAVAAHEAHEDGMLSGTPAYMAPEQLAGQPATVRSDIYALGLVLYEIYTGRRAFAAASLAELRLQKQHETPAAPSSISRDVDPIVERVIQRCIETDPRSRPATVLQVAAALPGADPLAAALAAGETPSPEMVAASAPVEGLRPAFAWTLLAVFAAGTFAAHLLHGQGSVLRAVPLERPPAAMVDRARDIVRAAGVVEPAADSAHGVTIDADYLRYVEDASSAPDRWQHLLPDATLFWYRQSPRPLVKEGGGLMLGPPSPDDPPLRYAGEVRILLDARGQLRRLVALAPAAGGGEPAAADWTPLFRAAGLEGGEWEPDAPRHAPRFFGDDRQAWTGRLPDRPDVPVRIEAASLAGRPASFAVVFPWTPAAGDVPPARTAGEIASVSVMILLGLLVSATALVFARRNLRLGRGDRQGATRLSLFAVAMMMTWWTFTEHHVLDFGAVYMFVLALGWALAVAALLWVLYVAVEPSIRRHAPGMLVSWTRLLAGELRDPLVGRDVLIGMAGGAVVGVLMNLHILMAAWLGWPGERVRFRPTVFEAADLPAIAAMSLASAMLSALFVLFILFVARRLLRRDGFVIAAAATVLILPGVLEASEPVLAAPLLFAVGLLMAGVMLRAGLLAGIALIFASEMIAAAPAVLAGTWTTGLALATLAVLGAVGVYAFFCALGGRPAFGTLATD